MRIIILLPKEVAPKRSTCNQTCLTLSNNLHVVFSIVLGRVRLRFIFKGRWLKKWHIDFDIETIITDYIWKVLKTVFEFTFL